MNTGRAFWSGVSAGLVVTAMLIAARAAGLTVINISMVVGSMLTGTIGSFTWWTGFLIELVISGLYGMMYGAAFERAAAPVDPLRGAGFSLYHFALDGTIVGLLPLVHPVLYQASPVPLPADAIPAPGFFCLSYGFASALVFAALHLIFGMLMGLLYEPARSQSEVINVDWEDRYGSAA